MMGFLQDRIKLLLLDFTYLTDFVSRVILKLISILFKDPFHILQDLIGTSISNQLLYLRIRASRANILKKIKY